MRFDLKAAQAEWVERGIGLLSFWTVDEELLLASAGHLGRLYQMHMRKGDPNYEVKHKAW